MLAPLAGVTCFHSQEMGFYAYTQARVLVQQEEYDAARRALQAVLRVLPDYELARELLDRLETIILLRRGFESFWEGQLQRYRAARAQLQAKLSTSEPILTEALPLYTKNALTGMGYMAIRGGGWSALRKTELIELIIAELNAPVNLERVVGELGEDERTALRQVLAQGSAMPWQDFEAAYGNDLEESTYWQWHVPKTVMGRLRVRGLLAEATVDGELLVAVPSELRQGLRDMLD